MGLVHCILYCVRVCVCVLKERMNGCDQSVPVCFLNLRGHVMTRCLVTGEQFFFCFFLFLPSPNECLCS